MPYPPPVPETEPRPSGSSAASGAASGESSGSRKRRLPARRLALPLWAWTLLVLLVAGGAVFAVLTRADDSSDRVDELEEELAAKDAELAQLVTQAQQQTFDQLQRARDEAERQLAEAANAREQAEQATEQADARFDELVKFEIDRAERTAMSESCKIADSLGYAQQPKPDASTYVAAALQGLPDEAYAAVSAGVDQLEVQQQIDECYQDGADRYAADQATTTTTTTTVAPPPEAPADAPAG